MAPQLLKDLATHSRKWIIQCRVSRKWVATNCNSGKVLHLDMVLIDSEGSDIWAMVPPLLIPKFESSLIEQEVDSNLPAPVLLPEVPTAEIPKISLAQLNDFKSNEAQSDKLFSVEGMVTQVCPNWCYMGCVACPRKVEEDLEEYFCGHCKTTSRIAKAKYRVKFRLEDSTEEADFAILEHEGLRFFGVMADELFQSNQRNKEPLPPQIHHIVNMTLKLTVKLIEFNIMNPQTEISVVSIDHDPLQQLNKDLCSKELGGATSVGQKTEAAFDCEANDQK
ncbi:unnamed protein product [Linum trigynum]|uniref:Replication factor A C-terminal domain-containing protein n=1 Tax=Linum trigynum TaxID=586398 RepID=A0AAV2E5N5_9ROSI